MRITFLALGSRGDIQPYVALGQGLINAGHQVSFITTGNFRDLIEEQGIDFYPIPGDAESLVKGNPAKMSALLWAFRNASAGLVTNAESILPALTETDMILNQLPGGAFGHDITEKYGVPMSLVATIPLVSTAEYPMIGWPALMSNNPRYNRWSYRASEQIAWTMIKPIINIWRKGILGLAKASSRPYLNAIRNKKNPVVNGFSRFVVHKPQDWGDHVHITGYWFMPDDGWTPPDALEKFVEQNQRPIYIGFGSMPLRNPKKTAQMIFEAINDGSTSSDTFWLGRPFGQEGFPENVLSVDYVPHSWLFPRVKAVVHHGGGGTTAAGLRAGVPSLIVPFLFDQFYWGQRIAELRVGPEPIPYKKLTDDRLAGGIRRAIDKVEVNAFSASLGECIRAENGVRNAIEVIENL